MSKYKLVVVDNGGIEQYVIGTFPNEEELRQWAEENNGELDDANEDKH